MTSYDVYATSDGELMGVDVTVETVRLIVGCLDCPAAVCTHEGQVPVDPVTLLPV